MPPPSNRIVLSPPRITMGVAGRPREMSEAEQVQQLRDALMQETDRLRRSSIQRVEPVFDPEVQEDREEDRKINPALLTKRDNSVFSYIGRHPGATSLAVATALQLDLTTVTGTLHDHITRGHMVCLPGKGPNGGFGYYVITDDVRRAIEAIKPRNIRRPPSEKPTKLKEPQPERTAWDHLLDD